MKNALMIVRHLTMVTGGCRLVAEVDVIPEGFPEEQKRIELCAFSRQVEEAPTLDELAGGLVKNFPMGNGDLEQISSENLEKEGVDNG